MAEIFNKIFVQNQNWAALLKGLGVSLEIAIVTAILGIILGAGLYAWKYSGSKFGAKFISTFVRFYSLMPGSTWLYICFYIFFAGNKNFSIIAAIVALTIDLGFSVQDLVDVEVSKVSQGEIMAAFSMGYSKFEALKKLILPQAMPMVLSNFAFRIMGHIRFTALLGLVFVADFQTVCDGIKASTGLVWPVIIFTAVVYMLLCSISRKIVRVVRDAIYHSGETEIEIKERILRGKV